jgi:protein gp37
MGDLFHDDVPFEYIAAVFGAMSSASQHTFLVLTKRPHRMREWYRWIARDECAPGLRIRKEIYRARHRCAVAWARYGGDVTSPWVTAESLVRTEAPSSGHWPIHVWLGVTAEDQKRADERIPILLQIPAALHWVSIEPCLGPVDISQWSTTADTTAERAIRFVVVGGESGPGARPMHVDWVLSLRDQCIGAGVHFLFKQWGEWCHVDQLPESTWVDLDRAGLLPPPNLNKYCGVGKKAAGRELDGKIWDQYPEIQK